MKIARFSANKMLYLGTVADVNVNANSKFIWHDFMQQYNCAESQKLPNMYRVFAAGSEQQSVSPAGKGLQTGGKERERGGKERTGEGRRAAPFEKFLRHSRGLLR